MRAEDWPMRLAAEIERVRHLPFRWGAHDCSLFACDVVLALTGVDHGAAFRGHYRSARGALKLIRTHGGLRHIATKALGPEISPLTAGRGDVAMAVESGREALGVCIGDSCAFAGVNGLTFHPLSRITAAWRVE